MGATYWKFNADSCKVEMVGMTPQAPKESEGDVVCADCNFNNTLCHIVKIVLKRYSLPGVLPPELVKLPNLREIDFAYNYLSGTIPLEWASTQLTFISVLANRLSGEIPKELGEITSLTYLNLEANQFLGTVPSELGKLVNLDTLHSLLRRKYIQSFLVMADGNKVESSFFNLRRELKSGFSLNILNVIVLIA
ncbi:unnamed protein product [Ilex paraguariensis]|uniref:Uncharacterized protein n=1 Tax=Ilex paraguariensis TaxID=185542 RepID=A0ABC8S166_9AQUA